MYTDIILIIAVVELCLVGFFAYLALKYFTSYKEIKDKFEKNPSMESQQMLADLFAGQLLLKVERLDGERLFYRRR